MESSKQPTEGSLEPRSGRAGGLAALVVVQLFFGLFPTFGKLAFEGFTPRAVAGWRFAFGAVVLGGLAWSRYGKSMLPARGDWLRLQVCALLGVALNMLIFMEGLERSTVVHAGLFMPVIPIWTFAIAVALRQERFEWSRGLGLVVALGGTFLLLTEQPSEGLEVGSASLTGDLCFLTNTFCYALFLVLSKPLLKRMAPLALIAWIFILSVWTVPLFGWSEDFFPAPASTQSWLSLGYILLFPTALAYLLNTYALARVSASTNATFVLLQPLVAVSAGVLILGEVFPRGTALAAAVLLLGVWLVIRRPAARVGDAGDPPR